MKSLLQKASWITVLFFCCTSLAHAALVDNTHYTTDTRTDLDWLDLNETFGSTYEYISSQMGEVGIYEGWNFASTEQLEGLLQSAGGSGPYDGWSTSNNGVLDNVMSLWAVNENITDPYYRDVWSQWREMNVMYGTPDSSGFIRPANMFDMTFLENHATADFIRLSAYSKHVSEDLFEIGASALVRVTPVPVPAALWLFGSGLLGLLSISVRRR